MSPGASAQPRSRDTMDEDFPRQLKRSLGLVLRPLSDIDYGAGVSYGILFRAPTRPKRTIPA